MRIPSARVLFALPLLLAAAARAADAPHTAHFEGFINKTIAINMDLTAAGGKITGHYIYAIRGRPLDITGTVAADKFSLAEETGNFALVLNDDGGLTGTWTSADGKRQLPVSLARIATTITLSTSKPKAYTFSTGYLQFPERNDFLKDLNAHLKNEATRGNDADLKDAVEDAAFQAKDPAGFHYEWNSVTTSEVTYADANFVSIRDMSYQYTGGAHGNYGYSYGNYTWRDAKLVLLTVADLLNPRQYKALAQLCINNLKSQKAGWPDQLIFDAKTPPNVGFTRAGLLFTFNPYEVSSYADGTYYVLIPWKEAAPFIPAESPIRRLMNPSPLAPANPAPATPPTAGSQISPAPDEAASGFIQS